MDPEKIPWAALRTLLAESIYGGRIDNDTDQRLLQSFISSIFRAERCVSRAASQWHAGRKEDLDS